MLAKNLGVHRGLVNGARGVVVGFEPGTKGQCHHVEILVVDILCPVEEYGVLLDYSLICRLYFMYKFSFIFIY